MSDPINLPPIPYDMYRQVAAGPNSYRLIKDYTRDAIEQNTAALREELDIERDSNAAKADRLDRLGEQIVEMRARVAELETALRTLANQAELRGGSGRPENYMSAGFVSTFARAALKEKQT